MKKLLFAIVLLCAIFINSNLNSIQTGYKQMASIGAVNFSNPLLITKNANAGGGGGGGGGGAWGATFSKPKSASGPAYASAFDLSNGYTTTDQIPELLRPPSSGGATTYNTASTAPSYTQGVNDPGTLSQYDQSIANTQSALGRLGDQLNSGYSSVDASYQNAINQLLGAKNQANTAYDTTKKQTATDYVQGKNTVRSNAGGSLNSLLRLLGSRGAGGSSAATITAPGAVARQATLQQTDLGNTFGSNNQSLDTNWNNYLQGYNNQVSSAGSQRDQQKSELQRQIDANRATLLQTLAQLSGQKAAATGGNAAGAAQPYLDQANAVLDATSRYSVSPINYQTQAYTAPSLSKYTVNPNAAPTYQGQAASNDYISPYLAALLGKKQLAGA